MTVEQLNLLEAEFQSNPIWNTKRTKNIAESLNINRVKVYKWHYDRKRRDVTIAP